MSQYILLQVVQDDRVQSCRSHKDIPFAHLIGNTNWTRTDFGEEIHFVCMQCGEIRIYTKTNHTQS